MAVIIYMEQKISAVLNTYNAGPTLERVLETLKGFDEIVVCDMESTDETVAIARRSGARVVTFPRGNHTICEPARDTAIHSAANPWVLVVDADELVPEALRDYLYGHIAGADPEEALLVPRRNMLMGEYVHSTPDYQLRFFMRDRATWPPIIHARPKIDGRTGRIPASRTDLYLQHLDDASLSSRMTKLNRYTDCEVPKRAHKRYGTAAMLLRPAWFFVRSLVAGGGLKDGRRGLVKAYMDMMYQVMLMSKVEEKHIQDENKKEK